MGMWVVRCWCHPRGTEVHDSVTVPEKIVYSLHSWKTSSRRMCALGWRKWRELRCTLRRLPCSKWERTSSANRRNRPANWQTSRPRWAHRDGLEFAANPNEHVWDQTHAKINYFICGTLWEYLIKCTSDATCWEAVPKGGGNCFKTAGSQFYRLLIDTMSWAWCLTTSQLKHKTQ